MYIYMYNELLAVRKNDVTDMHMITSGFSPVRKAEWVGMVWVELFTTFNT